MADRDKDDQDAPGATWLLLTALLDLLRDKGVLTDQDLAALAEAAHSEATVQRSGKKGTARLKKLRDKSKSRA